MPNQNSAQNQTSSTNSAADALKMIMQGNINKFVPEDQQKVKMVETRKKIPNIVMRKTVEKLRRSGKLNDRQILDKILKFDELAEKGEFIDYLKEFYKKKAKNGSSN